MAKSSKLFSVPAHIALPCEILTVGGLAATALAGPLALQYLIACIGILGAIIAALVTAWGLWERFSQALDVPKRRIRPTAADRRARKALEAVEREYRLSPPSSGRLSYHSDTFEAPKSKGQPSPYSAS